MTYIDLHSRNTQQVNQCYIFGLHLLTWWLSAAAISVMQEIGIWRWIIMELLQLEPITLETKMAETWQPSSIQQVTSPKRIHAKALNQKQECYFPTECGYFSRLCRILVTSNRYFISSKWVGRSTLQFSRDSERKSAVIFPELLWGVRAMSLQLTVFAVVLTQPLESLKIRKFGIQKLHQAKENVLHFHPWFFMDFFLP